MDDNKMKEFLDIVIKLRNAQNEYEAFEEELIRNYGSDEYMRLNMIDDNEVAQYDGLRVKKYEIEKLIDNFLKKIQINIWRL